MKNFSIRDIEHFSGIKAHTLRIWEQRYDFIKPGRNQSNFRHYTIEEVHLLLNIAQLTRNGFRISRISCMDCEEINLKLNGLTSNEDQHQLAVNEMIVSMYTMNTDKFESTLDQCFQRWSADVVLKNVILEFLKKTGLQWKGRRQTEEHLAVTTIRNKISASIDKLNVNLSRRKSVLLFLPDSKQLDLVLLYTCFILRSKGYKVLYMGMDVTIPNLKMIFKSKQPDVAITYLPVKTKSFYNELSHWLSDQLPHSRFFIIPYPKDDLAFHSGNISVLSLEKVIEEFSE